MAEPVLELLSPGWGASLQDAGRVGWKKFGVPPGGALDDHAACAANRLVGNTPDAPLLELLLQGARVRALVPLDIGISGAAFGNHHDGGWRVRHLTQDEVLTIPPPRAGMWTYLAVSGGLLGERWFGSTSVFPRGGMGEPLAAGALLQRQPVVVTASPAIAGRWWDPADQRDYSRPPALRVWPGPQWRSFSPTARDAFVRQPWKVSPRSDRTGYRLDGHALPVEAMNLPSEPVLPGSIQVPANGAPIVTLRDGPTVGGYPKIGLVDPDDLSWLVQSRPGQEVRFSWVGDPSNPI